MKSTFLILALVILAGIGYFFWVHSQKPVDDGTLVYHGDRFSVHYPQNWFADTSYQYDLLGPEEPAIPGVKFHVPIALIAGTNLTTDTGISVEQMAGMPACRAEPFLISPQSVADETVDGTNYSVASSFDAAAGNRYEETVYALKGTNPCIAVRYFVHYSELGNFDPDKIMAFDHAGLIKQFDTIRRSLTLTK